MGWDGMGWNANREPFGFSRVAAGLGFEKEAWLWSL
jgi:hypothetical protein